MLRGSGAEDLIFFYTLPTTHYWRVATMRIVDSHTHTYLRGPEDLELMSVAGIEGAVICSYLPMPPTGASTLNDLFSWQIGVESPRLSSYRIDSRIAVGIHPRSIPTNEIEMVYDRLISIFDNEAAPAMGEIGLESGSKEEADVFVQQLRIAKDFARPVIVHAPRKNKAAVFEKTIAILKEEGIDGSKVILDHLTPDLVPIAREYGALAGLTIQPGELSPKDVEEIVSKSGPEGIVLNSNIGDAPSDPLALPRTVSQLTRSLSARDVELMVYSNIRAFMWF